MEGRPVSTIHTSCSASSGNTRIRCGSRTHREARQGTNGTVRETVPSATAMTSLHPVKRFFFFPCFLPFPFYRSNPRYRLRLVHILLSFQPTHYFSMVRLTSLLWGSSTRLAKTFAIHQTIRAAAGSTTTAVTTTTPGAAATSTPTACTSRIPTTATTHNTVSTGGRTPLRFTGRPAGTTLPMTIPTTAGSAVARGRDTQRAFFANASWRSG